MLLYIASLCYSGAAVVAAITTALLSLLLLLLLLLWCDTNSNMSSVAYDNVFRIFNSYIGVCSPESGQNSQI